MEIKDGKIIKATNAELHKYWLEHWWELMSYTDYKNKCIELGTEVIEYDSE